MGKHETEERYDAVEGVAGTADPGKKFREMEISEEEKAEIEHTREQRLDPENRPENAEVDNTHRDFDADTGEFTDHSH